MNKPKLIEELSHIEIYNNILKDEKLHPGTTNAIAIAVIPDILDSNHNIECFSNNERMRKGVDFTVEGYQRLVSTNI